MKTLSRDQLISLHELSDIILEVAAGTKGYEELLDWLISPEA